MDASIVPGLTLTSGPRIMHADASRTVGVFRDERPSGAGACESGGETVTVAGRRFKDLTYEEMVIISAIAEGRRPAGMQPDEEAVYSLATELLDAGEVSDATFRAAKKLGEAGVVELLGVMGYYGTVSMLVNTDRYPLPEGIAPELKPLAPSR